MSEPTNSSEIACSLTNDKYSERRAMVRKLLVPYIIKTEKLASGLRLTFPDTDDLRSRVDIIVSLERDCCGFLAFTVTPPDEGLSLTIEGPPESLPTLEMFAAAVVEQ